MAGKIVTLYIDDVSVRLLVSRGKRIKKWAEMPLEPGLIKGGLVLKEAEVSGRIAQFLKAQKVSGRKVVLGLSGLNCLSRPISLPQLPRAMLAEAVIREAKRALPVPPEQLYLSWQTMPAPEGTRVFLVAMPRQATDVMLRTLLLAGIKPGFVNIKPLALTGAVQEPTAIIVDAQPTDFDIVVKAEGIPQPIRTVPFPGETLSWREKLPMIRDDLDRTIKFYNSNNVKKQLDVNVPVFVSGELASRQEECIILSRELGHTVFPLPSPLECPENLDLARYTVNMGLVLNKISAGKRTAPPAADLNLLPQAYGPQPVSWGKVAAVPGAVVAAGVIVSMVILAQGASANILSMRSQLQVTEQLLKQKRLQKQELTKKIAGLDAKLADSEAARDSFIQALASLVRQGDTMDGDLETAASTVSDNMSLSSIDRVSGALTVSGKASSQAEVLSYARKLEASERFSEIVIVSMNKTDEEVVEFVLLLKSPA